MIINDEQKEQLNNTFMKYGLNKSQITFKSNDKCVIFYHNLDETFVFQIKQSVKKAFADIYCCPYTYQHFIYFSFDHFEDCLALAKDWAQVLSFKIKGKTFYNKIFISHASNDKTLITEFVDRILKLACGYNDSEIVYTSLESTGVEPGNKIPEFIKENLTTSSIVLFMISDNYKQSEVCLNEMGAAWALDRKIVSIVLPSASFEKLGWLTSLNKALKIDNSESLDKLYSMLCRKDSNVLEWNQQKESFLKFCLTMPKPQLRANTKECKEKISPIVKGGLSIFDIEYKVSNIEEGDYHFQLDLRMRADSKITLRRLKLVNKDSFAGNSMREEKELELNTFIPYGFIDIDTIPKSKYKETVIDIFSKRKIKINDFYIDENQQISITFAGLITTIRECDGYSEFPLNNWSIIVEYNIDQVLILPIQLKLCAVHH